MLLLACEQAHLYGVSGEYFGGEAAIERAMGPEKFLSGASTGCAGGSTARIPTLYPIH